MIGGELLAPAGNLAKLKLAFRYGADAAYLGGKAFSLRSFAENFTEEELADGIAYAHARGKKVYVAANIFARNGDLGALEAYFCALRSLRPDGVLVSDPGVFRILRRTAPDLPVHISTQANNLNAETARFWADLGAKRVVLGRELNVREIAEIHAACPEMELEAFIHGAMCISYSGRCYLSDYLDGRESNRGACVQACRYVYEIRAADGKSGWMPVQTDGRGTYLLNSRDLNMSARLAELAAAGVCSFKIEGRMKSEFYLATVVNAYRRILDGADAGELASEFDTLTHRAYTSDGTGVSFGDSQTAGTCEFIAIVRGYENGRARVEMRGRFYEGETLELLTPSPQFGAKIVVAELRDGAGEPCRDAKLVQAEYTFACGVRLYEGDILRRRK